MRAPTTSSGDSFQVFGEGGKTHAIVVGTTWREFSPEPAADAWLRFNPENSLRVLSASTTDLPDLVDGAAFTPAHRPFCMPVEPGWSPRGYDRTGTAPRFFFVLDPDVDGSGDVTLVMREAAR